MKAIVLLFLAATFFISPRYQRIAGSLQETGRDVYEKRCVKCHGRSGTRGFRGARDLTRSRLDSNQVRSIIKDGQGIMPAWKNELSEDEIEMVIRYITTLRK